ncbi:uncharacterized protein [Typha angustifolia]|uniref:uncharacterized protein n=1 Tax=Typha angustifolia TaxID=59011 RepID=UPI003C2E3067
MAVLRPAPVTGGGIRPVRQQQVWPVDDEADQVSQRLVEAAARGDRAAAEECLGDRAVDVNYAGAVWLKARRADVGLREEAGDEVRVAYEEIRTDVTPLFLAAHGGDLALIRSLLAKGADVNQNVFFGYATTAAVREGRAEVVELLVKAGASQPACEEALVEAAIHGRARLAHLLMGSDLVRPHVAVHALVTASARGFVDVVDALIKCGADTNATDRMLLRSLKPSLHTNVDCTALVVAIVCRQVAVVRRLLQAGVRIDTKVRLGAWSWDMATGEEFRVGAGLAEPYDMAWCAVEYFESTGTILRLLLHHHSLNALHLGRTLLHHAILCGNALAVQALLSSGTNCEFPVKTSKKNEFRPIHMAARLGLAEILQVLIDAGCDLDSRTESSDTGAMLCARYKHEDCLKVLASAGADLGLVNSCGASAALVAASNRWSTPFECTIIDVIRSGKIPKSSDPAVFSPVMFASRCGDVGALEVILMQPEADINEQDESGFSPVMIAAKEGHVDAFRYLVFAGADVKLKNKRGETAVTLSELNKNRDLFEQVMLEFALEKGGAGGFCALHWAARRGDLAAVRLLASKGCDVNVPDGDGCTPLMLAAREGHGPMCELLISYGAKCDTKTPRGETALSLARANAGSGNKAEEVIMDELARILVLKGGLVMKHTRCGKGSPHMKSLRMIPVAGVLRWGKSSRRNIVCKEAEAGASSAFQRNRRAKGDAYEPGMFRVVTPKGREVHFVCDGGKEAAELWVRGIRLVTMTACGRRG